MALNFYCGSPGAGKTYHVVKEVVIQALLNKKNIITNLPLKTAEIYKAFPQLFEQANYIQIIKEDRIKEIHKIVDTDKYADWIIIIDEAHDYWPSNEAMKDDNFKSWLSQHRHKFQNIVMITQDFSNINKFVRSMVQERFEFEKNESKGSEKSYMQDFFLKQSKKRVDRKICRYDPKYYQFYRSHDVGMEEAGFKEERVGKKMNLMKKPFIMAIGGGCFAVIALFMLVSNIAGGMDGNEEIIENRQVSRTEIMPVSSPVSRPKPEYLPIKKVSSGSIRSVPVAVAVDWCRNVVRVRAGAGADEPGFTGKLGVNGFTMSGGSIDLKGAYTITGAMILPGKAIYFVKDLKRHVYKVEFVDNKYQVGENICL